MKTERIVLSFIAVVIGVLASAIAFYLYQSTRTIPEQNTKTVTITAPSPTRTPTIYLSLDSPPDESVTDKKTITISGKTIENATIIISTQASEEVIKPATNGNFSTTLTLEDGQNLITVVAISPDGEEAEVTRTVTFSGESF